MKVKATILAGGRGTRFKPYTDIIAKPMIPLGKQEKPLLEYIINWLSKHDIKKIILLIGYHGYQIMNYFRDGDRWGVKIKYSRDNRKYRDTGGALLNAYHRGLIDDNETILIWYGDIIAQLNPKDLLKKHWDSGADATLALAWKYQLPVGVAEIDDQDNIVRLIEKPWQPLKVTIGILALESKILRLAEENLGGKFDIMSHLIPWLISTGRRVKAYHYTGPWYDVGSLERYAKLDAKIFKKFLR